MSSGLGLKGNVSRCYQYFEDFATCMVRCIELDWNTFRVRNVVEFCSFLLDLSASDVKILLFSLSLGLIIQPCT